MELEKYSKKFIHYYSDDVPVLIGEAINANPDFKTFADLGCGDGSMLYSLNKNKLLGRFDKIYAIDLSKERINNVKKISPRISCLISDACNVPDIPDSQIDMVIATQIIEHLKDDELLVREIKRIIKREGIVYISTVFKKWYGWYFFKGKNNNWVIDPTHEREYTADNQLLDLLKKHGFLIIQNKKTLHRFALTDFILKRVGFKQTIYEKSCFWRMLRKFKIPIIGYYNWEILCCKRS